MAMKPQTDPEEQEESKLPVPPAALARIISIAGDPSRPLTDLGKVCAQDPGLTVELLRMANSARYGFVDPVRSVPQAVVKLGARAVRAFAITYSMRAVMGNINTGGFDTNIFWEDCLRRASCAHLLAELIRYDDPFEAFALGLCEDLGTLLLACRMPHLGTALHGVREKPGPARAEAEKVLTGRNHADEFVNSHFGKLLPESISNAVALHHSPPSGKGREKLLTLIGHTADIVADVVQAHPKERCVERARRALTKLKVPVTLAQLLDTVADRMIELAADMAIELRTQPSLQQLLTEAQHAMIHLAEEQAREATRMEQLLRKQEENTRKLEESNAKLLQLARKDSLTGLDNRRVFNRALITEMERVEQQGQTFSTLILDVDHFKKVNDTYGHPAGDAVLKTLASRMQSAVRAIDRVARLGGEEFGILLPGTARRGAQVVAERIRASVAASPILVSGTKIHITISVGGATVDPSAPPDIEELIELADRALYTAKEQGRNRVIWHRK